MYLCDAEATLTADLPPPLDTLVAPAPRRLAQVVDHRLQQVHEEHCLPAGQSILEPTKRERHTQGGKATRPSKTGEVVEADERDDGGKTGISNREVRLVGTHARWLFKSFL